MLIHHQALQIYSFLVTYQGNKWYRRALVFNEEAFNRILFVRLIHPYHNATFTSIENHATQISAPNETCARWNVYRI